MNRHCVSKVRQQCLLKQQGIVMPMLVVALVALMAMGGLALDGSHLFVNKSRLQNVVDATALSAAKKLSAPLPDTALATDAGQALFDNLLTLDENQELVGLVPEFQYSDEVNPFIPSGASPKYARVVVKGLNTTFAFLGVLGINNGTVSASAVAGPDPMSSPIPCTPPSCRIVLHRDFISGADS